MNLLLVLHSIALRWDGLRPELVELLRRQTILESDPKIAVLKRNDEGRPAQAGPSPMGDKTGLSGGYAQLPAGVAKAEGLARRLRSRNR